MEVLVPEFHLSTKPEHSIHFLYLASTLNVNSRTLAYAELNLHIDQMHSISFCNLANALFVLCTVKYVECHSIYSLRMFTLISHIRQLHYVSVN
jgi:hypothetical protein